METCILTVGELPSHNHTAWADAQGNHQHTFKLYHDENNDGGWAASATGHLASTGYTEWSGNHSHNVGVGDTGSNQSHNNMQPYISVYIWKRTA